MGDESGVQSGGLHCVEAVTQRGDELKTHLGLMHLNRVRVEGDGHGVNAELVGTLHAGGDDLLVTVVHAVEVTDGDDTDLVAGDLGQGLPDVHCLSFLKNQDGPQRRCAAGRGPHLTATWPRLVGSPPPR